MRELVTTRLRLHPLTATDASRVYAPLSDERLYEFLDGGPPATLAELESRFRRWETRSSPKGDEVWLNWIADLQTDGRPVGWFQATILPNDRAELAYVVFLDQQRRGYGYEGGEAVLKHLFEDRHCRQVLIRTDPRNEPSLRLARRLGFTVDAAMSDATVSDATLSDRPSRDHILSLTRPALPPHKPS